jgi:hypothetical protein
LLVVLVVCLLAYRTLSPSKRSRVNIGSSDAQREADMTPRFLENVSTWLSLVGNAVPPRDPNGEDDDEDEEDEDEDEDREPAVIREPDEDE